MVPAWRRGEAVRVRISQRQGVGRSKREEGNEGVGERRGRSSAKRLLERVVKWPESVHPSKSQSISQITSSLSPAAVKFASGLSFFFFAVVDVNSDVVEEEVTRGRSQTEEEM